MIRGRADAGLRPVTYDWMRQVVQNPLGIVSAVDLTPCSAVSSHGTGVSNRWLGGVQGRRSERAWQCQVRQQVHPVSLLTVGARRRQVAVGDHAVTVEHRGTCGTHPVTELRGGASDHNDLRVLSLREEASKGVTALFDLGVINRALGRP
jgi:hypothetical protein